MVTNDRDEETVRVPYAGVIGDWNAAPVWSRTSPAFTNWVTTFSNPLNVSSVSTGIYAGDYAFAALKNKDSSIESLSSLCCLPPSDMPLLPCSHVLRFYYTGGALGATVGTDTGVRRTTRH